MKQSPELPQLTAYCEHTRRHQACWDHHCPEGAKLFDALWQKVPGREAWEAKTRGLDALVVAYGSGLGWLWLIQAPGKYPRLAGIYADGKRLRNCTGCAQTLEEARRAVEQHMAGAVA